MRVARRWAWRRSVECATLIVLVLGLGEAGAQAEPQDGPFVYVTNARSANVSQYSAAGGPLAPLSPATVRTGNNPSGVAASPDGTSVYVTTSEPATVLQYSVGAGGALSLKSSAIVPDGALPGALAVSPD